MEAVWTTVTDLIIPFLVMLGILVFIHELGHFLTAKWFKMRVDAFSVGFPPRAFGKKIGDTDYCVSWVPLGGYCKIAGMVDESLDTKNMESEPEPWEFRAKPVWQRVIVISGGVLFNFFLAVLIFFSFAFFEGKPIIPDNMPLKTVITDVVGDSPAAAAGLENGDQIVAIDGREIMSSSQMVELIGENPGKTLDFEIIRDAASLIKKVSVAVVARPSDEGGGEKGQIGVMVMSALPEGFKPEYEPMGFGAALAEGFSQTAQWSGVMLGGLWQIVAGEIAAKEALGGPVAILKYTGDAKKSQGWSGVWKLMALLSISLAIFNLFPIPALDGGHLVFLFVEAVIRKPVSLRFRVISQQVGMAILILLIVFFVFNDITRWVGGAM